MRLTALFILAVFLPATVLAAEDFPRGQIIDNVQCLADAFAELCALSALELYARQALERDPWARCRWTRPESGRTVSREAAEKYGYIVAGSKNSRNGPLSVSVPAANAVWADVSKRFSVDPKRLYLTGQSGGARVAMYLATHKEDFPITPAGVIASSAFFPGDEPPVILAFPVFGTAGTEDFNHLEMRQFDRDVKSTHRLEIFDGGHMWLPIPLATEAIEWMELQAMKGELRPTDEALIRVLFDRRVKQAQALPKGVALWRADAAIAADFTGLRDVDIYTGRAKQLSKDPAIVKALDQEVQIDEQESRLLGRLLGLAQQLGSGPRRTTSLAELRTRTMELHTKADVAADSPDRQLARRVLRGFIASARGSQDAALDALLEEIRPAAGRF